MRMRSFAMRFSEKRLFRRFARRRNCLLRRGNFGFRLSSQHAFLRGLLFGTLQHGGRMSAEGE